MDREFSKAEDLLFRYSLETELPPDTMARFIVQHHTEIFENADGKQVVWRHGVKLSKKGATALVIANEHKREIQIYVKGMFKSDFVNDIRSTFNNIFRDYKSKNPLLEYKITVTQENEPVYKDDGTIIGYWINKELFLDVKTGVKINMEKTVIEYNIYQQGATLNNSNLVLGSEGANISQNINKIEMQESNLVSGSEDTNIVQNINKTEFHNCVEKLQGELNAIAEALIQRDFEDDAGALEDRKGFKDDAGSLEDQKDFKDDARSLEDQKGVKDDASYLKDIKDITDVFSEADQVVNNTPVEQVGEAMKVKGIVDQIEKYYCKLFSEDSDLYKRISKIGNGKEKVQRVLRLYNDVVKMIPGVKAVLPEVPEFLLK